MVLSLSDQKLPITLMLLSLIWGSITYFCFKKKELLYSASFAESNDTACVCARNDDSCIISVGNMLYNKQLETFYGADNREINLTPMQFELMQMFLRLKDIAL